MGMTTVRHIECELLIKQEQTRCLVCVQHRKSLSVLATWHMPDRTAPNSHVNYRYLTDVEKDDRLKRMHTQQRVSKQQVKRLKDKLASIIEEKGIIVDSEISQDLDTIMAENTPEVAQAFPENSFERLFWEQQQKALSCKDSKQMRWHPLMINDALDGRYLYFISDPPHVLKTIRNCMASRARRLWVSSNYIFSNYSIPLYF